MVYAYTFFHISKNKSIVNTHLIFIMIHINIFFIKNNCVCVKHNQKIVYKCSFYINLNKSITTTEQNCITVTIAHFYYTIYKCIQYKHIIFYLHLYSHFIGIYIKVYE